MCHYTESITLVIIIATLNISPSCASNGDRTHFFRICRENCERSNCSADGIQIQEHALKYYQQSVLDQVFQWSCADECQYGCMWRTVDAFLDRGWSVPQFYGKWPFKRLLGLQEPAAVLFSVMNFIAHIKMLQKFRREVRSDSPCYGLWHLFGLICLNGWIWSTIFHARDSPFTEFLDYAFAFLMVYTTFYCMVMRMTHRYSIIFRALATVIFIFFYFNYFIYLSMGKLNYTYNMTINITIGALSALGWLLWCYVKHRQRPYYKKILKFYILFGMSVSLEFFDFPPMLWLFDAHAIWHLSTVPLVYIFYSFIIEDCNILRKEKALDYNFNKSM